MHLLVEICASRVLLVYLIYSTLLKRKKSLVKHIVSTITGEDQIYITLATLLLYFVFFTSQYLCCFRVLYIHILGNLGASTCLLAQLLLTLVRNYLTFTSVFLGFNPAYGNKRDSTSTCIDITLLIERL